MAGRRYTQNLRVLSRLAAGPLTALDAQRELGVMRLGARIYELKRAPYRCVISASLVKVCVRHGEHARVAQYHLIKGARKHAK